MALREILGQIKCYLVLRKLLGVNFWGSPCVEFLELLHQSSLLGNAEKYTHSRAGPVLEKSVLVQLYCAYISHIVP